MNDYLHDALDLAEETVEQRHLTFLIDGQLFGIPITDVVQIVGMQAITVLPETPEYVKGVINLRGQIIPLIDIRLRFSKPEAEYNERTCVIIVHVRGNDFGFIVDEVDEVTDISDEQVSPPPKVSSDKANAYLSGIARLGGANQKERVALLIHPSKILDESEFAELAEAAQN